MKNEPPKPPVQEGEIIAGKYRVERILGRGGMGVVVAATHIHLRQRVAIKFLLTTEDEEMTTRFMREARASARMKSEHVTRVLDVAALDEGHGGVPYMVMEYLDGSDLSQLLKKRGRFAPAEAVDYLLQACEAIAEAHSLGIIHRDLKPANLFLTQAVDGSATIKVLDFGISKDTSEQAGEEEMELTRTRAVLGSPHYMAPEQIRSTRTVDARADIYSLGVILYQLVTKAVPFRAPGFVELAMMVITDPPTRPSEHRPDLDPGLEAAILRCLAKDPAARFASVAELAAEIAPYGGAESTGSAERISRTQGAAPPSSLRSSRASGTHAVSSAASSSLPPSGPSSFSEPVASIAPPSTTAPGVKTPDVTSRPSLAPASTGVVSAHSQVDPLSDGVTTAKNARPSVTSSTWAGPPNASPPSASTSGNGKRNLVVGVVALALVAAGATGVVVHGQARDTTATHAAHDTAAVPSPALTQSAVPAEPSVTTATTAAAATTSTTSLAIAPQAPSPRGRPGAKGTAAPTVSAAPLEPAKPAPSTQTAAPPPAPPAVVATPPPAAPPPPAPHAPPPPKKGVLDIDIK